jgi:hypothetical protein
MLLSGSAVWWAASVPLARASAAPWLRRLSWVQLALAVILLLLPWRLR